MSRPRRREDDQEVGMVDIGRRAISSFGPAVKSALLYTLMGIIVGILLLWWQHYLEGIHYPNVFWIKFLEHLGVGFIVSAIAVFFYEWGAHIKETVELSERLSDILESRIAPIATAASITTLERFLRTPPTKGTKTILGDAPTIFSQLTQLLDAISDLQNTEVWGNKQYLGFISYQLHSVVQNATALRQLGVAGGGDHLFRVDRDAAIIADEVLAAQMKAMGRGDYYDVISSLPTWKDGRLAKFHQETQSAVERGANVRRVLNLRRYPAELLEMRPEEARSILDSHLKQMQAWSTKHSVYEVRVLGDTEYEQLDVQSAEKLRGAHFGVFRHDEENVRFSVEMPDLSYMRMVRNRDYIKPDFDLFNKAWDAATPLTPKVIDDLIEDLKQKKEHLTTRRASRPRQHARHAEQEEAAPEKNSGGHS